MINEQSNERTIERNYALKLNFGLDIPQKMSYAAPIIHNHNFNQSIKAFGFCYQYILKLLCC